MTPDSRPTGVVHRFPDSRGVMGCCGLHKLEVNQNDQASLKPEEVTCMGAKRYRTDTKVIPRNWDKRSRAPHGRRA